MTAEIPGSDFRTSSPGPRPPLVQADKDKTHNSLSLGTPARAGIGQSQEWGVRVSRDCVPSLDSDPPAHSVPMFIHRALSSGLDAGPSTGQVSKQKMARQENLQRTLPTPKGEGRSRQLALSCCPSAVTRLPGTGREKTSPQGQAQRQKRRP